MVQIEELAPGDGPAAVNGNKVVVKYKGSFPDGKVFDQGEFPFTLGVGQVIQGFDLMTLGMKVGGKRKATIPPEFGYGTRGAPPTIPGNATLVFEVELLKIS